MTGYKGLAALQAAAVILVSAIPSSTTLRAVCVVSFWTWVPGAALLAVISRSWLVSPSVPAMGVSVGVLVLVSELGLVLGTVLGRGAMLAVGAASLIAVLVAGPRHGRADSTRSP